MMKTAILAAALALTAAVGGPALAQMQPPPHDMPGGPPPGHGMGRMSHPGAWRWHRGHCRRVWRHHHKVKVCR